MTKITFEDLPSTNTPLSASNLNTLQDNVETAINTVDNKIPKTIWTGTLYGTQSITLENAKRTLIIYAYCNIIGNIVYTLDCVAPNRYLFYASGTEQAFDTSSGLELYTSESSFNTNTKTFTQRNYGSTAYNGYYIYRIDTVD